MSIWSPIDQNQETSSFHTLHDKVDSTIWETKYPKGEVGL